MKKKLWLFGGFITVLVFVILVLYLKGSLTNSPIKLPLTLPTTGLSLKEYVSEDYNFSVSYPSEWKISTWDLAKTTGLKSINSGTIKFQLTGTNKQGKFEILVWDNSGKAKTSDFITWYLKDEIDPKNVPQESNYLLNNIDALEITQFSEARQKILHYFFFDQDDKIYELLFEREDMSKDSPPNTKPPSNPVYDQIIDSFKFTGLISPTITVSQNAQPLITLAKEDLAEKLGIATGAIEIVMVSPMQWSDTSLGCPEPGMFYSQVITAGYLITLRVNGKVYPYNTNLANKVILCSQG